MFELNRWRKGDNRAPHKPLLLLMALGAWQNERTLTWSIVKEELGNLIEQFSNSHKKSAVYPFIRLQADGYWEVDGFVDQKGDARVSELNAADPKSQLSNAVLAELAKNPLTFKDAVDDLLAEFPPGLHSEILDCVQINLHRSASETTTTKSRDPDFRRVVLNAYSYQCSVCGYGGRMDGNTAGVEAAHIKWHAFEGPDTISNGMALCSLHHKLFDLGTFGLTDEMTVIPSSRANGPGLDRLLFQYEQREINLPRNSDDQPSPEYIAWHRKEVYKP